MRAESGPPLTNEPLVRSGECNSFPDSRIPVTCHSDTPAEEDPTHIIRSMTTFGFQKKATACALTDTHSRSPVSVETMRVSPVQGRHPGVTRLVRMSGNVAKIRIATLKLGKLLGRSFELAVAVKRRRLDSAEDEVVRCSTTPLLTAVPTSEKKDPVVLIRSHPKVYVAICYQLAQFMLAASIIVCSIYVRHQALSYMAQRIEKLHGDIEFFDKLRSKMDASMRMYALVPLIGGILMAAINMVLIYQCFNYGIDIASNLWGTVAVVTISFLLLSGSCLLFLDASRYPNDSAGASQDNIYLFMHVVKVAIDEKDPILNKIIYAIHEKLECCGFHSVNDYYSQRQIDYPPPLEGNQPWEHTFRLSNRWVHNCSNEATEMHNTTHICYAPRFCCSTINSDVHNVGTCPPMKWDGASQLVPSRKMYRHPCAWRVARNFRNKMLNVTIISLMNSLTAITNAVHLLRWRSRSKSPPSTITKTPS